MKATYEIFKEIALIFVSEGVSQAEINSLLTLVNKLAEVGINQVIVDMSKADPDSQAVQTIITVKPKLRNGKKPQGLFVGKGGNSVSDFTSIIEALDRFPSGEGLKVKELYSLKNELQELVTNLKAVDGVLKMPGSIEQKQKAIFQKNNYLKRIHANLDAELAWLKIELASSQNAPKTAPIAAPADAPNAEATLIGFFNSILNPA